MFTYRSYTPIPFLIAMIWFASPTVMSLAVGFVISLLGEAIRFWGVLYAGSETRTTGKAGGTQLVTSGPYAHVRNPLYIGNILIYLGVGIMSNALVPWLQLIALFYFILQYRAIVSIEEEYLSKTFSDWKIYCANVRRFVPKLKTFRINDDVVPGRPNPRPNFPRAVRSERSSLIALTSLTILLIVFRVISRGGA